MRAQHGLQFDLPQQRFEIVGADIESLAERFQRLVDILGAKANPSSGLMSDV